jgi:radical SAM protein with 4Fe4S-binding SPASM domain
MIRNRTLSGIYKSAFIEQGRNSLRLAHVELTHRCNFKCIHCYIREDNPKGAELSLNEYSKLIKQLKELQCLTVVLTGGEPLLHPQFIEIYRLLKSSGFLIIVMTNAYALSGEHFKLFKEMPPYSIEVSLYGFSKYVFEKITQTKFDYKIVKNNIVKLISMGLKVNIKSVILNSNFNELQLYKRFARRHKLRFRFDVITHKDVHGYGRGGDCCSLDLQNAAFLLSNNRRVKKTFMDKSINFNQMDSHNQKKDGVVQYFKCGIGKNILVIDPYGYGHPCLLVRNGMHNIRDMSANEIIHLNTSNVTTMKREELKCDTCNNKKNCSWCPGVLYINSGDLKHLDNYCELNKLTRELVLDKVFL